MSPVTVTESRDELKGRREGILSGLGRTLEELRAIAATSRLTGEEFEALEELDEIDFLLGGKTQS